jgi:hypothetical protein
MKKIDEDNTTGIGCMDKAKKYFELHHIQDDDGKVKVASINMQRHAYNWFRECHD